MTRLELSIAWRYLRSRRRRRGRGGGGGSGSRLLSLISLIAIGGVMVGVSALIIVIGVMNGLQGDLMEKILIGSPDVRVLNYGENLLIEDWENVLAKVKEQPGVVGAAPFVITQAGINSGHGDASGVYVVGIQPEGVGDEVTSVRQHAVSGDFKFASSDGEHRGAVVGKLLSQRFGVYPGDTINLISISGVKENAVTGGFIPRIYSFEVTGIVSTGMYEYDNTYVYIPLKVAQEFAALGNGVTGIEVKTADRWKAAETGNRIAGALGFPYHAVDWQQQNRSLFQALKLEKLGMGVILLLIVIVAAFNIVSTLIMVVKDKTREIGILKAMGMTSRSIRRIFMVQGFVIGVVGTGLGLLLGFGATLALAKYKLISLDPQIYFIDHLPVNTNPRDVLIIIASSLAIAALATLYPAIQASKLYPVEAIRSE